MLGVGGQLPVSDLVGRVLRGLSLLLAVAVDVRIGQDAVQPGLQIGARPERPERRVGLDHGFLHQVPGIGGITGHSQRGAVELVHQRDGVPLESRCQFSVGFFGFGCDVGFRRRHGIRSYGPADDGHRLYRMAANGFSGKTMFISGASRGIGLAIAKRIAADGANVALVAKTTEPHPKLPGTIYTAAKEIEEVGGHALPIVGDVRDGDSVAARGGPDRRAVRRHRHVRQQRLGNQPGLHRAGAAEALRPDERYRGARHLRGVTGLYPAHEGPGEPAHPHPVPADPIEPKWLRPAPYMMAKYGMSLCALGIAEELKDAGIASNTLWPRTMIATAAVQNLLGGDESMARSRKPEVYADAAYAVLSQPAHSYTGQSLLCEDVLLEAGVTDLSGV